ncbi:hypothetical protein OF83DRAFT_1088651 [Amylostereum chailletii]|nr:hypothetical protein OF83DRAFT_1088651 [Amylostereum chailletii]
MLIAFKVFTSCALLTLVGVEGVAGRRTKIAKRGKMVDELEVSQWGGRCASCIEGQGTGACISKTGERRGMHFKGVCVGLEVGGAGTGTCARGCACREWGRAVWVWVWVWASRVARQGKGACTLHERGVHIEGGGTGVGAMRLCAYTSRAGVVHVEHRQLAVLWRTLRYKCGPIGPARGANKYTNDVAAAIAAAITMHPQLRARSSLATVCMLSMACCSTPSPPHAGAGTPAPRTGTCALQLATHTGTHTRTHTGTHTHTHTHAGIRARACTRTLPLRPHGQAHLPPHTLAAHSRAVATGLGSVTWQGKCGRQGKEGVGVGQAQGWGKCGGGASVGEGQAEREREKKRERVTHYVQRDTLASKRRHAHVVVIEGSGRVIEGVVGRGGDSGVAVWR